MQSFGDLFDAPQDLYTHFHLVHYCAYQIHYFHKNGCARIQLGARFSAGCLWVTNAVLLLEQTKSYTQFSKCVLLTQLVIIFLLSVTEVI